MTPGAGSSELAPVFLCPLWGRKFSGRKYRRCAAGAAVAQAERPSQAGNGAGGQRPTCGGRFSTKQKNRAQNNPPHIGRGLWTPCGLGLWAGENRGLYSLEHGGAVIPPCVAWDRARNKPYVKPQRKSSTKVRSSQEFCSCYAVGVKHRGKATTAQERRRA